MLYLGNTTLNKTARHRPPLSKFKPLSWAKSSGESKTVLKQTRACKNVGSRCFWHFGRWHHALPTLNSNCRYLLDELFKSLLNLTLKVLIVQMGLHKGIAILLFAVGHYKTYGKRLTQNAPIAKQPLHRFEHQPMSKLLIFSGIGAATAGSKNQPANLVLIPLNKAAQRWNKPPHPDWPT